MLIKRLYSQKTPKVLEKAFTQRLEQLEAQYPKENDALLGKEFQSLIDKEPKLLELEQKLQQNAFNYQNQQSIQAAKIPSYADRQARDNALSAPWSGNESQKDSTLRMLVDKHKPKVKASTRKLASAKETVLDYRLNKGADDEDTQFRNIYKEKFTPIGSFDKIKTLADARIEEAIRQGQFKNIPRGKKLDTEVKPYVERTEHHLNNILIKQNIVPPWIEKQGGVNGEINSFRNELKKKWETHIQLFYNKDETEMNKHFKRRLKTEYENKIRHVNNSIRTYNLQAPLSTQKFYLLFDKEFDKCFEGVSITETREQFKIEEEKRLQKKETQTATNTSFSLKFWKWGSNE